MESREYLPILQRVGRVLIVIGLLDIGVMVYCIVNSISYSSSFNVFAVVAGVFLLRGSLRTASYVRWFAAFQFAALLPLLLAWPFIVPLDLSLTLLRLHPLMSVSALALAAFVLGVLHLTIQELGREPVQTAIVTQGVKQRNVRTASLFGIGLVVILLGAVLIPLRNSESAHHAMSVAESEAGPGYRFYLTSLHISKGARGTSVSAAVTAWNDREIKTIPIHWKEP